MPNNFKADNDFLMNTELDQLEYDDIGRIRTDYDMRTDYKRIFAPGAGGVATYFAANDRVTKKLINLKSNKSFFVLFIDISSLIDNGILHIIKE